MAETSDGTWGLSLARPTKGSQAPEKKPSSQAGSPWAQGAGGGSLTHVSGEQDDAGGMSTGTFPLLGKRGWRRVDGAVNKSRGLLNG